MWGKASIIQAVTASAVLLPTFAGSATQMRLAPELAATSELKVEDRQHWKKPMTFGRWQAAVPMTYSVKGWKFGVGGGPLPKNVELSMAGERASLQFDVSSQSSAPTHGNCLAQGKFASLTREGERTSSETTATLPGFPRLDCEFTGARAGVITLRADFPSMRENGTADIDGTRWQVRSINNLQRQKGDFPLARFGYEFVLGDRVVGAVETYGNGRIWMLPDLSPAQQDELSTLMTALLFYGTLLDLQDA